MGVEFTQSGEDIVVREDENYAECMGCFRPTDTTCPTCHGGLCADCKSGHICQNDFDDEIVEDIPGFSYVSREDQDKFERLLTDPFGR